MTHTQKQEQFESRVGLTLISSHTFQESQKETRFLRVLRWDGDGGSGRQSLTMWCEWNGELIRGTQRNGQRLTKGIKETFGL